MSNWKRLRSDTVFSSKYFQLRVDQCETFDGRVMPRYYVVEFPDWVQVVALDKNRNLILVEQYRYPGGGWFLEFPGGSMHPDQSESAETAARRELREETGFVSDNWEYVGDHFPNPALMSNRCRVFIARDCVLAGGLELDPFEELRVRTTSIDKFEHELLNAERKHSLMIATFGMVRSRLFQPK